MKSKLIPNMETLVEFTPKFKSIAVLDFETSDLSSYNNGKTAITELCIYGLAADLLCQRGGEHQTMHGPESDIEGTPPVPPTPRVLHKLTLLMNPYMRIHPIATTITGLDNFLLEPESKFTTNTADTLLGFLQHLQQPVCLVAHNGWKFDFPILKQTLQNLNKELPTNIVCVDSLRAFMEIDNKYQKISLLSSPKLTWGSAVLSPDGKKTPNDLDAIDDVLYRNESQIDWRNIYGAYKLKPIYIRKFKQPPENSHHAEADVNMLMKLILHYGADFMDYAEKHAAPFSTVPSTCS